MKRMKQKITCLVGAVIFCFVLTNDAMAADISINGTPKWILNDTQVSIDGGSTWGGDRALANNGWQDVNSAICVRSQTAFTLNEGDYVETKLNLMHWGGSNAYTNARFLSGNPYGLYIMSSGLEQLGNSQGAMRIIMYSTSTTNVPANGALCFQPGLGASISSLDNVVVQPDTLTVYEPTTIQIDQTNVINAQNSTTNAVNSGNTAQQNRWNQEDTKISQNDTDGQNSSTAAQTDTQNQGTTLLQMFTALVGAITSANAGNCTISGNMGHLNLGQLNYCDSNPPAFVTTIGSLFALVIVGLASRAIFKQMIGLFQEFTR